MVESNAFPTEIDISSRTRQHFLLPILQKRLNFLLSHSSPHTRQLTLSLPDCPMCFLTSSPHTASKYNDKKTLVPSSLSYHDVAVNDLKTYRLKVCGHDFNKYSGYLANPAYIMEPTDNKLKKRSL